MAGADAASVQIPDGFDIFAARFGREGDDLVISAEGGQPLTVVDYFTASTPPALVAPSGAMLTGDVVALLAGPRAPAQYAQADAPEGAAPIGQVAALSGSSTATRATCETVELALCDPVFQGDVIETGADSTLGIRLEDGTLASLSAQSRLVLNEFVFETGGSDNWMLVNLVEGAFAFLTGAIAPSGGMEITTPVAVMAIRGTMPIALVSGDGGATQFFAGSPEDYELLHLLTREVLAVVSSASGISLTSPDAALEAIELDPDTLDEINNLLEGLNEAAAELGLLGIQHGSSFHTYSPFGNIDGNLAALIEFLLLLDGALTEDAVIEVADPQQFLMAEAELIANPDQAVTQELSPIIIDVLPNDIHPEGGDLTVIFADVPAGQGSVTIVDGKFVAYDPGSAFAHLALGETADVIITYAITNGSGAIASTTVTVTVTGLNDAPVVSDVTVAAIEDGSAVTAQFAGSDIDSDDDQASLTYTVVTPPAEGTVIVNDDGTFDFDPGSDFQDLAAGETRTVTFTYTATDRHGAISDIATATVTVTGVNDTPVVSDISLAAVEDGPTVTANFVGDDVDSDDDPTSLVYSVVTQPAEGTVIVNDDGTFDFDPGSDFQDLAAGETREVTFTYVATDRHGAVSDPATATVTVTGVNDDPVIVVETTDASGTVAELPDETGSPHVHEVGGTIDFADVDASDTHSVTFVADGSGYVGAFALGEVDQDGSKVDWTFSVVDADIDHLPEGEELIQTYTITIDDKQGGTVTQVVTITLIGANDAPIIVVGVGDSDSVTLPETNEGLTATGSLSVSDASVSDVVSAGVTKVEADGEHDSLIPNATLLGFMSVSATVISGTQSSGKLIWDFDSKDEAFDFLADGEKLVLIYEVTVTDNISTVSHEVTITILGTNDAPVITAETLTGSVVEMVGTPEADAKLSDSGTISFTDLDLNDTHTVTPNGTFNATASTLGSALGTLSASLTATATAGETGEISWTYEVDAALVEYLAAGEEIDEAFDITLSDGKGGTLTRTVVVTITGTNDAPVITAETLTGSVLETLGTPVADAKLDDSGTISFTDVDLSDTHTVTPNGTFNATSSTLGSALGTLSASLTATATAGETGEITWTYEVDAALVEYLAAGEEIDEAFDITLSDGKGGTITRTVVVTITGTNDAPVITAETGDSAAAEVLEITGRTGSSFEHTVAGKLTFSDVDISDNAHDVLTSFIGASGASEGLGLTPAELDALFSATITEATGVDGTLGRIGWTFSAEDATFDFLDAGEVLFLIYKVTVIDDHGDESSEEVVITVHGATEGPIFDFVVTNFSGSHTDFRLLDVRTIGEDTIHLLLTPTDDSTKIDTSNNNVGIGGGDRKINPGEGVRAEVITNASVGQNESLSFSAYMTALAFTVTITGLIGGPATVFVRTVLADSDSADQATNILAVRVNGENRAFELSGEGILINGLNAGDVLTILGAEPFTSVEIFNGADGTNGGGDFLLTDIGFDAERIITGTDGKDFLLGTDGDDYIFGMAGDDVLMGLGGLNTLEGGAGNDLFVMTDLSIHDVIVDYGAGDVIDLTRLGFELATGEFTAEAAAEFVRYDPTKGELSVDVDGFGDAADFELAAVLLTQPSSIVVRLSDGSTTDDVVIV